MDLHHIGKFPARILGECWAVGKETFAAGQEDNVVRMAAALAFYTMFSLAPALLIALGIAGAFIGSTNAKTELVGKLTEIVTPEVAEYVFTVIDTFWADLSDRRLPLVGIAGAAIAATAAFAELQSSLNAVWGVNHAERSGFLTVIYTRIISFVFVVGIGILILISVLATAVLTSMNQLFSQFFPIPSDLVTTVNLLITVAMIPTLLALCYKLIPDVPIEWKDVWFGAVFASVLFFFGKWAFGIYLRHSTTLSVYGAAGSLVILLVWVYYSSQVFFLGAELTKVWARRYGSYAQVEGLSIVESELPVGNTSDKCENGETD
ncbi:MAG: YihY/virulence factor BrkB family protein [Desulfomonilaceae bacterium]|nr:YihY/virulence factor BrkB family protein [Desulfomonilaceae bacterium]